MRSGQRQPGIKKFRVAQIITSLKTGGAETMLLRLLSKVDRDLFEVRIYSLGELADIGVQIRALGFDVEAYGINSPSSLWRGFWRLVRDLHEFKPDVTQTWLYHADLIGSFAVKLAGGGRLIWSVLSDNLQQGIRSRTLLIVRMCQIFSGVLPRKILFCSDAGRATHEALGYARSKSVVIPLGFDLKNLVRDHSSHTRIMAELALAPQQRLIGLVARFDPLKDHATFFLAAERALASQPDIVFLCCGSGVSWDNPEFVKLIPVSIHSRCKLLGERRDIVQLMSAFDIATLSSYSESFPLVIGEAMACETPCVVTDVGAAKLIVGDCGYVVPPRSPQALADGWLKMLSLEQSELRLLGLKASEHIRQNFDLTLIAKRYERLWASQV